MAWIYRGQDGGTRCPCGARVGEPHKRKKAPSLKTIEKMVCGETDCKATDGCVVEPDGKCPHGHSSWLRVTGMI